MQAKAMLRQSVNLIKQLENAAEGLPDSNEEETVFHDKETALVDNSDTDFQQGELQNWGVLTHQQILALIPNVQSTASTHSQPDLTLP